jgi:anti-anti-sigma factor
MDIKTVEHGSVTLVNVAGRIVDGEPAERLQSTLRALVTQNRLDTIVDLSDVAWFDSTGIEILVGHYVSVSKLGGRVLMLGANDKVKQLFRLVRLDDRFGWADSLDEALGWFGRPA